MMLTTINQIDTNSLIEHFICEQDIKASSKSAYSRALRQYFKWVKNKGLQLTEMNRLHIIEYKNSLLAGGMTALSVNAYLTVVRRFYAFCESYRYFPNIAKDVKAPKRKEQFKKQPLNPLQVNSLISKSASLRDKALLTVLIFTGIRTIEAIRLDVGDITMKAGKRILMIHGKGRDEKDDFVILPDAAFTAINNYLITRKSYSINSPLFVSQSPRNNNGRLTTRSVSRMVKETLKEIGLNDRAYCAHSLRHSTAVAILKTGGSMEETQQALRHCSIDTTKKYTFTMDEERRLSSDIEKRLFDYFQMESNNF